jgi:hypothetical protein
MDTDADGPSGLTSDAAVDGTLTPCVPGATLPALACERRRAVRFPVAFHDARRDIGWPSPPVKPVPSGRPRARGRRRPR